MSKTISIKGVAIEVTTPYVAGHVITEIEAKVLNQTRAENIGNNFRASITEALAVTDEAARDAALAKVLADLTEYDSKYNFTMGGSTRTPVDPVEAEALRIAKEVVKSKIAEKYGMSVKKYLEAAEGNQEKYDAAVETKATQADVLKEARKRLDAKKKLSGLTDDDMTI